MDAIVLRLDDPLDRELGDERLDDEPPKGLAVERSSPRRPLARLSVVSDRRDGREDAGLRTLAHRLHHLPQHIRLPRGGEMRLRRLPFTEARTLAPARGS